MSPYILMTIGILVGTIGQLLMKYSAQKAPLTFDWSLPIQILTNIPLMLVFAWYFVGAIMWIFILQKLPLSLAYPTLALNYVTVALGATLVFHEPLTLPRVFAYLTIIFGVALLYRAQA